jgi:hypothetical protein
MMCLFFKFCQILQISNLLPARSLENPAKAQATPDCKRQFETDTLLIFVLYSGCHDAFGAW